MLNEEIQALELKQNQSSELPARSQKEMIVEKWFSLNGQLTEFDEFKNL